MATLATTTTSEQEFEKLRESVPRDKEIRSIAKVWLDGPDVRPPLAVHITTWGVEMMNTKESVAMPNKRFCTNAQSANKSDEKDQSSVLSGSGLNMSTETQSVFALDQAQLQYGTTDQKGAILSQPTIDKQCSLGDEYLPCELHEANKSQMWPVEVLKTKINCESFYSLELVQFQSSTIAQEDAVASVMTVDEESLVEGYPAKPYDGDPSWMWTATEPNELTNPDLAPSLSCLAINEPEPLASTPHLHASTAAINQEPQEFCIDWKRQYRHEDKDLLPKKERIRHWYFSTPPLPAQVYKSAAGAKYMEKLRARKPARKTVIHTWEESASWGASWVDSASWGEETSWDDEDTPGETTDFETFHEEISWKQRMAWERFKEWEKFKAFRPSLLRWCCTVAE
jgi:hypothetical protein